jgi:Tol biopolymer transport system component/DNA-binding winged helix-turn-helix (wHTH) protein
VEKAIQNAQVLRFGTFEVDLRSGEVRKGGLKLKLSGQSFQVLAILLECPGQIVTREEFQKQLWPETFVDVDHSLNTAINKIREVLGDSAEHPRYVETLSRRGYRFIAPVNGGVPASDQFAGKIAPGILKTGRKPLHYGVLIVGSVLITIASIVLWKTVSRVPRAPKVLRFTPLTSDGQAKMGQLVTDGSRIYFNEVLPDLRTLIAQVSVNGGEAIPLAMRIKRPLVLDLSKGGTDLLVANVDREGAEGNSFWVQPVAGGSARRVGSVVGFDARFGVDASSIIYSTEHDVYSLRLDGSSSRKLLTLDGIPFGYRFSRDARLFRFTQLDPRTESMTIMEAHSDGTGLRKLFPGSDGNWTTDGRFFIFLDKRDGRLDLWAGPEARSFPTRGRDEKPIQVTAGPLNFSDPLPSKDGKQIFAIGGLQRAEVIRYDSRSGQFVPYLSGISADCLAFSSDGDWVTYVSYPDGTLWRSRLDGSERLQLTFSPMRALLPRWSPDGKQIVFNANLPDTSWNIYLIQSTGGTPQPILPSEQGQMDANWSPDGDSLVFASFQDPVTAIYTIDLGSKRISTLPASAGLSSPRWSPDGRYVVAIRREHPALMQFDRTTQKWTEAFGGYVNFPSWSHDGKSLYFESTPSPEVVERIVRLRLSDRKVETIAKLDSIGRLTVGTSGNWFGLAPDDSPLLARDISTQEIYALEMDWP